MKTIEGEPAAASAYGNPFITGVRGLISTGTIRCAKCDAAIDEKGLCAKCGNMRCYILLYHQGATHKIRRDEHNKAMGYLQALDHLVAINRARREMNFNILDWLPGEIRLRQFKTVIGQWFDQKDREMKTGELSRTTLTNYSGYIDNYYLPALGTMDVRKIGYPDLERFRDNLPKDLSKKTRRNILNGLHAAFRWLWRAGIITEMPPFPTISGSDATPRKALTYEEQIKGLAAIPDHHRDIFIFGFETGLRPGELCVVKTWDMKAATKELLVQRTLQANKEQETTKGKRKSVIPLSETAWGIAIRRAGMNTAGYLFINPETGRRYTVKKLNQLWHAHSGVDCCHYEAGRHSFCSQLAEQEINPLILQDLMRHADLRTTKGYCHPRTEMLREKLNLRGKPFGAPSVPAT